MDLYRAGFQEVLGVETDLTVRKVMILEGPTVTLEGNIDVSAGAGLVASGF